MSSQPAEYAQYSRGVYHPSIELLQARYQKHSFAPHYHDVYAVGLVEAGALTNVYKHKFQKIVAAGELFVIHPGEVHTGKPVGDLGVKYRMLYLPTEIVTQWIGEHSFLEETVGVAGKAALPADLPQQLVYLHNILTSAKYSLLKQECVLTMVLTKFFIPGLFMKGADPGYIRIYREVENVKEYIAANYSSNLSLKQLAAMVHVSPFHFLRMFQKQVGLSPHSFQTQIRIEQSKQLIRRNEKLAQVSAQVGFYDQSHFIKAFKALVGTTPNQYLAQNT
jgi:AraC-like DNA-binding protein